MSKPRKIYMDAFYKIFRKRKDKADDACYVPQGSELKRLERWVKAFPDSHNGFDATASNILDKIKQLKKGSE